MESNQLYQLFGSKGESMLKREMQEMIELMFYPDDYEELQSLLIVNYETGMYIIDDCDTINLSNNRGVV